MGNEPKEPEEAVRSGVETPLGGDDDANPTTVMDWTPEEERKLVRK